jgi:hypothetical protein
VNPPPDYLFHWGALATQAPCRPEDQRIIREVREAGATPDSEPRGSYPRRLVAAARVAERRQ